MPRVLFVGHGIAPHSIGGAVQYQWDLIEAVHDRGWETTAFFTAPRYSLSGKLRRKAYRRGGVRIVEIVNSPYLPYHEVDPAAQCRRADLEAFFREHLDEESPDVIHVHELQMYPASLLDIARERGIPILKTMHNYYDVCPQHDLMYRGNERCTDDNGGARCVECLAGRPGTHMPLHERWKRAMTSSLPPALFTPYRRLKRMLLPGQRMSKALFQAPASGSAFAPGDFAERRRFFLERLNRLDLIHCASAGAAAVFTRHGVSPAILRVVPLATRLTDAITPRPLRSDNLPIVFGFMGGEQHHKGYGILIEAMKRIDARRARLEVWNTAWSGPVPGLPHVFHKGIYNSDKLNGVLAGIDVGIVPSIWEESFGLVGVEFTAAKIPIIGSRIGGIPQWLDDGVNGLLFSAGDATELAERMKRFTDDAGLVRSFQERMKPWKSFATHVDEMISLYQELLQRRNRPC